MALEDAKNEIDAAFTRKTDRGESFELTFGGATSFLDDLIARATAPDCIYSHPWKTGDVIIWDERALLHRGTPWPYSEARELASVCVSASDRDGLAGIRP